MPQAFPLSCLALPVSTLKVLHPGGRSLARWKTSKSRVRPGHHRFSGDIRLNRHFHFRSNCNKLKWLLNSRQLWNKTAQTTRQIQWSECFPNVVTFHFRRITSLLSITRQPLSRAKWHSARQEVACRNWPKSYPSQSDSHARMPVTKTLHPNKCRHPTFSTK